MSDADYHHSKGRDCERTDEVLENYRQRAIHAERALNEVKAVLAQVMMTATKGYEIANLPWDYDAATTDALEVITSRGDEVMEQAAADSAKAVETWAREQAAQDEGEAAETWARHQGRHAD